MSDLFPYRIENSTKLFHYKNLTLTNVQQTDSHSSVSDLFPYRIENSTKLLHYKNLTLTNAQQTDSHSFYVRSSRSFRLCAFSVAKNTIKDVYTILTVHTTHTALHCLNSSMYAYIYNVREG